MGTTREPGILLCVWVSQSEGREREERERERRKGRERYCHSTFDRPSNYESLHHKVTFFFPSVLFIPSAPFMDSMWCT